MTAALTALLPGGPRNARPGAGAPQGDFAQVLERISASEGRDDPAVRPRDRAEAPGVRTPDRSDSPDRPAPVTVDPADGRTDAPATGDTVGPVEPPAGEVPTQSPVPVPLAAVQAVALATVAAPVSTDVVPAAEADAATPGAVPTTTPAALPADTTTTTATAVPTVTSGTVAPVGPAAGSAVQAPVPAPPEGDGGRSVAEPQASAPGAEPSTTASTATSTSSATPVDRAVAAPTAPSVPPMTPPAAAVSTPAPVPTQAPAPATAATPLPLAEQLGARLTALTGPGGLSHGKHILTVPIDPENLGPVRIVAHIGPESVRVELVGATDASREALRGVLTELRRDLAASGLTVDVGSDGASPDGRPEGRDPVPWQRAQGPAVEPGVPVPAAPDRPPSRGLDLLA